MKAETLHIRTSSMQFSDPKRAIERDVPRAMPPTTDPDAPDVIVFSETPTKRGNVSPVVREVAEARGWQMAWFPGGDCPMAVHPRHTIESQGWDKVLDPYNPGPGEKGGHGRKGVGWVRFTTPEGNDVTVHGDHWVTGYRLDRTPGQEHRRERKHDAQTQALIARVIQHGKGTRLSFWAGDTNVDEERDQGWDPDAFHAQTTEAGLVSVFDELGEYPSTHGNRTIDVIGSYDPDKRVSALRVKVGAKGNTPERHSDHRIVDAWYRIKPMKGEQPAPEPARCPTCGQVLPA
jgi:hypothetical protein